MIEMLHPITVKTVIGCYFLLPDFKFRGHPRRNTRLRKCLNGMFNVTEIGKILRAATTGPRTERLWCVYPWSRSLRYRIALKGPGRVFWNSVVTIFLLTIIYGLA